MCSERMVDIKDVNSDDIKTTYLGVKWTKKGKGLNNQALTYTPCEISDPQVLSMY